jgi:hypothetical protein
MANEIPLTPPNFVDNFTPANPLGWLQSMERHIIVWGIPRLRPANSGIDRVEQFYRRARLMALLTGRLAPANEEQAAFLAEVGQGQPVSLLSTGSEGLATDGFAPTLRKVEDGWQWQAGAYHGQAADLKQAVQFYVAVVNQLAG